MDKTNTGSTKDRGPILIAIGLIIMLLLSLTQLLPSLRLAGYSVFAGIVFFFVVEAVSKTPKNQSGLRFRGLLSDLKKPGVLIWVLLPIVTAIVPMLLGDFIFNNAYSAHVLSRTDGMLSYDNAVVLVLQLVILALGEEIAWRGFFVGMSVHRFPFWLCAVVSSLLFAMGHIASGNTALVLYDVSFVFIDSLIFSVIYRKTGNCAVSTVSHILGNAVGLILCFAVI